MSMHSLDGAKVLVTGAAGFIGSHLTQRLLEERAQVRAFLRYDSQNRLGHLDTLNETERRKTEIVRGDLKDPDAVARAVDGCDIVFHLGALIAIPFSYQNPTDYVQTNVLGTMHALNACLKSKTKLIHTSTSEVYGTALQVPLKLDHPKQAQSPYSASKIAADALVVSYARSMDLPAVILRPFNTFGPRQSPRAVIPTIIRQALAGETVHLGSIHPTRDFLFVSDTVNGFIAAAKAKLTPGTELQIGTGIETSIGAVVKNVESILGKTLAVVSEEQRVRPGPSEVERLLCDYSEAKRLLQWEPRVAFQDGLKRVIDCMRSRVPHESSQIHDYVI